MNFLYANTYVELQYDSRAGFWHILSYPRVWSTFHTWGVLYCIVLYCIVRILLLAKYIDMSQDCQTTRFQWYTLFSKSFDYFHLVIILPRSSKVRYDGTWNCMYVYVYVYVYVYKYYVLGPHQKIQKWAKVAKSVATICESREWIPEKWEGCRNEWIV